MTFARFGLGLILALLSVLPLAIGAWSLRRALLPAWTGAPARLAEAILGVAAMIVVLQLLGLVSLLYAPAVVLAAMLAGGLMRLLAGRIGAPSDEADAPPAPAPGPLASLAAMAAGALVLAEWSTRLIPALERGMTGADTVWYHLPQAASFVQDGSITHVQFFETGAGTAFYPATSGLFHAVGMLWFGNDFLSPFINLAWLGLVLLAAWCLGRPYGLGPHSLVGVALVLATPIMVETQPGGAYNDVVGLALFLAAAALLVNGGPRGAPALVAALAAAPALGTKLSFAVPLAALAVGAVAVAPAGSRLRSAGVWLAALLGLGGVWYVRNLFAFGNPIPALDLDLGPLSLVAPPLTRLTFSLVHYLDTPGVWEEHFRPGLLRAYGPAWPALLALALTGMAAAIAAGRTRVERMLGAVALVSAVAFVVTPQGLGTEASPSFFEFNLRYPTPALVLGLGLLPLARWFADSRRQLVVLGVYGCVLLATQLDPAIWPLDLRDQRFAEPSGTAASLAAAGIGVAVLLVALALRRGAARPRGPALAAVAATALVAVVVGGWLLQRDYLRDRYGDYAPLREVSRWAADTEDARIGIAGFFIQYPLYGRDLSNRVEYVARHGPHGAFTRIESCRDWRRALNDGGYRYVVTTPFNYPGNLAQEQPEETGWTSTDPAAELVLRENGVVSVFRLDGRLDPDACTGT